jgi:branched-chain amino acid transport system substrate-binding protein
VAQVIADKPDVIFSQTDAPTVAVLETEFTQLGSTTPWIGTDVTTSSDFIKAFGTANAHAHLTSVMGTSLTGQADNYFMAGFKKMFPSQAAAGPLSGSNYAYDAVITLALADTYAKTTKGSTVSKDMTKVTNPPGTKCYSYKSCVALIKAKKKINYEGASGSIDFNKFHNTFGPYAPFIADGTTGNEVQGTPLSAKILGDVTNCASTSACLAVLKADGVK